MQHAAVTTFNDEGFHRYGRKMVESFDRLWPEDVTLYVYIEGFVHDFGSKRIVVRDLNESCPDLVRFKARHKDNPVAHGKLNRTGWRLKPKWRKLKVRLEKFEYGLGYRWDAVQFSHKVFAVLHAAENTAADVLFWIDGDILTFEKVPDTFADGLMPADCLVSFLQRKHNSETGFVGYNLRHPEIRRFLDQLRKMYVTDRLFREKEYNDCWLFDVVRKRFEQRGCRTYDIAEGVGLSSNKHVFINSRLGLYMDHLKGDRKVAGRSDTKDLVVDRDQHYWQDSA